MQDVQYYAQKDSDSSVVCESGSVCEQMVFSCRSEEFSRNFGFKVIYLFFYIKLMLNYAE